MFLSKFSAVRLSIVKESLNSPQENYASIDSQKINDDRNEERNEDRKETINKKHHDKPTPVPNPPNPIPQPPVPEKRSSFPEKLVFTGEGMKILANLGLLKVLNEITNKDKSASNSNDQSFKGSAIKEVCGISMGSLIALLVVLQYSYDEIETIMMNFSVSKIRDTLSPSLLGDISMGYNLWEYKAFYSGLLFETFLTNLLTSKEFSRETTFADLAAKSPIRFNLLLTNITKSKLEVFNADTTPTVKIVDAIRAACNLVILFPSLKISQSTSRPSANPSETKQPMEYCDAILITNYYLSLWDTSEKIDSSVLGLMTVPSGNESLLDVIPSAPYATNNIYSYLVAAFETILHAQGSQMFGLEELSISQRTITVPISWTDTGIDGIYSFLFREMTGEQRTALIAAGEAAARKFFSVTP